MKEKHEWARQILAKFSDVDKIPAMTDGKRPFCIHESEDFLKAKPTTQGSLSTSTYIFTIKIKIKNLDDLFFKFSTH